MLRTIILLILALIAIPIVAFRFDQPLSPEHWAALKTAVTIMAVVASTCFVVSELTRNCSQVDKLWSIIPIVYVWYFAVQAGLSPRLTLMAVLVSVWGARLTFNFGRRGGYHWIPWKGEEDYRWSVLRKTPLLQNRLSWAAFNLFFISFYQNTLILLFTLPALAAWQGNDTPLNWLDYTAALLMFSFIVMETVADQQQYNFQTEKYRRIAAGQPLDGEYAQGFCASGLWSKMRHPNYAAEQAIWISFYLFSVAATGRWFNWSIAGAILLMLLFMGSADFSEKISAGKYAGYAAYQKRVGRF
ncbi:MAG: DUF1295 domain-containing protein, partial [Bacteroidota bacterium]